MTEQQEASEDAVMTRIGQAVILLHAGDREEARNRLGEIWSELGTEGDSLHRCTLAHYLADAQDDPAEELAWDLRALKAADADGPGPPPAVRVFYPSLHLSLATDYVKLRRPDTARIHLARARAATGALGDDGYGNGVRAAIARLERRLAAEPREAPRTPFPGQNQ
ncbi:hypothetical protein OTB20_07995 [Streptomyces sp. H27-H1]|uniref:hypothetical protein n=1 Tax=Streptomyces sp. H27-H1 TaxID=2996461 RepID=UPI00226E2DA5|nr:hypothetical protein [Streptomyces sp. H27-H1]MCY0926151.1 hypothetical protein [Streptomyces sp. H27-H1]